MGNRLDIVLFGFEAHPRERSLGQRRRMLALLSLSLVVSKLVVSGHIYPNFNALPLFYTTS